ncbi:hypothetical protein QAD02_007760 [Eretmocerus hayati]|uniref:Uncharacterized protein n=1 Tax=Eretmocerus hayati TaxID=131215 RepID=A0ACC2N4L3_9HYME|nr:hypothetical protein QAD02_007760 [Eretmocerus hayati]
MVKCLKCPRKNDIAGKIVYCKNYDGVSCLGAYHPACSVRAGQRENGSFRYCCPIIADIVTPLQTTHSVVQNIQDLSSFSDNYSDCEELPIGIENQIELNSGVEIDGKMNTNEKPMSTDDLWEKVSSLVNQESDKINENVDKKKVKYQES